jgi:hypothetical protein
LTPRLDWTAPAIGAALLLAGALSFAVDRLAWRDRPRWRRQFFVVFMGFSVLVATGVPLLQWKKRIQLISALRSGRASIVEGQVRNVVPMPRTGHSLECFTVRDTRFCYSDFVVSPGFNNTQSHGGPIREGLQVRIHHVDGAIVRFEIAP